MRSFEETRKRWNIVVPEDAIGVDLRQAVREPDGPRPCEDGLRSVCWKAFLLYGPLSQSSWTKKLADSRSAYSSLRDHFLKYINHPDDLQSSIDPLADDENSPWASLRQDETSREEIFQDIERCMQDNYFFREPSTQKKLLDILFIYSKLNPDTGYRQGMHELLAPILWVVDCDAVDSRVAQVSERSEETEIQQLMLDVLDVDFVEHDAFSLFCAVMQTAKSFYEVGDSKPSTLVGRSHRIHDELLATIDPDLEYHLRSIEILPQIYLIRWVRLLFGREFAFDDVLRLWDLFFAEKLSMSLVEMTCIAMLLRIRWQLLKADYSVALSLLLHYSLPQTPGGPASLAKDAVYLDRNRSPSAGANVVGRHTGQPLVSKTEPRPISPFKPASMPIRMVRDQVRSEPTPETRPSPNRLSARFLGQQKGLEALFQEVSGEVSRRTEGWAVAKAVKGAVGGVRRNVNNLSADANVSRSSESNEAPFPHAQHSQSDSVLGLTQRIQDLEDRNKILARMLGTALESLRKQKDSTTERKQLTEDEDFNVSLAKLQFVQVYLADPEIPIPAEETRNEDDEVHEKTQSPKLEETSPTDSADQALSPRLSKKALSKDPSQIPQLNPRAVANQRTAPLRGPQQRPTLAESSFSFMLGESRQRSSFVSSVTVPPEQRRDSDTKSRPKQPINEGKESVAGKGADVADDGFTMSSLQGSEKA